MNQTNCGLLILIILILFYQMACGEGFACPYPGPERMCCGRGKVGGFCCGRDKFACMPTNNSVCSPPANGLYLGPQTYWIAYQTTILNDKVYSMHDVNNWPLTFEQAQKEIPIGSSLCWNGQVMGKVTKVLNHVNMPYSSFIVLDRNYDESLLAGQNVTIKPPMSNQ